MLSEKDVVAVLGDEMLPGWLRERQRLSRIDRWARWDHDPPHKPNHATPEYRGIAERAQAPWGSLVVTSVAQTLYVEGYRRPSAPDDNAPWMIWQRNGMDSRQVAIHSSVLTYGLTYGLALPGRSSGDDREPTLRGVSPREMYAVYGDPAFDEWPELAVRVARLRKGWRIWLYDDTHVYEARIAGQRDVPAARDVTMWEHGIGTTPVVRYTNRFDLEGRSAGEIEPFIPLLGRIDQTSFDRLVVQRFASWIVRTIAGMDLTKVKDEEGDSALHRTLMKLSVGDILTADDPDTKFGSLPATPLDGFISAGDSDKADLAAVTQTPAFELLAADNVSAEFVAAANASKNAKTELTKLTIGESHEQLLRLGCHIAGHADAAADYMAQVRWKDTSLRSLAVAVDAFGKMVTMLGFPPELLWDRVPGITAQDVDEAKTITESRQGALDVLARLAEASLPAEE